MQMPHEEKLETRRERPQPLARPWDVLEKVEQLSQSQARPELVVGIGLSTGRGIVEILHTGHFTRKSAYSLLFAAPMTMYEVLCVPFEVPTLVRVETVLAAVDRVRQYFGKHFQGLRRREISQQCRPQIQEAAYKQVWNLVPLRPEERNAYKSLAHGVYSQLAAWLYCPANVDPLVYMATIQHHRKIVDATSEEERLTLALAAGYREYVVMDTQGVEDQRRGIRLGEPGVEVLSPFQETMPGESDSAGHAGHVWMLEEVKAAIEADPHIDDDWDEEDLEVLRLSLSTVILEKDGTINRCRGIKLGEPDVKVLEVFQPREEQEGESTGKDDPEAFSPLPPSGDDKMALTREEVQEKKEAVSLPHLLACFIYEVQVNVIENDPPAEILDTLATLIEHAPVFVMELVEGLRRTSPEDQEEDYPSRLPTFVDGDA